MNNSTLSYFKLKDLFGNHLNKFYHFIDSGLGPLEKLLTENHCYDSINFSHIGPEFEDNLNTIVNLSGEKKHALKNLSTFYAHHYLSLNAEFLQHLLAIQTGPHPTELYIRFLRKLRNDYLIINKATLNVILE